MAQPTFSQQWMQIQDNFAKKGMSPDSIESMRQQYFHTQVAPWVQQQGGDEDTVAQAYNKFNNQTAGKFSASQSQLSPEDASMAATAHSGTPVWEGVKQAAADTLNPIAGAIGSGAADMASGIASFLPGGQNRDSIFQAPANALRASATRTSDSVSQSRKDNHGLAAQASDFIGGVIPYVAAGGAGSFGIGAKLAQGTAVGFAGGYGSTVTDARQRLDQIPDDQLRAAALQQALDNPKAPLVKAFTAADGDLTKTRDILANSAGNTGGLFMAAAAPFTGMVGKSGQAVVRSLLGKDIAEEAAKRTIGSMAARVGGDMVTQGAAMGIMSGGGELGASGAVADAQARDRTPEEKAQIASAAIHGAITGAIAAPVLTAMHNVHAAKQGLEANSQAAAQAANEIKAQQQEMQAIAEQVKQAQATGNTEALSAAQESLQSAQSIIDDNRQKLRALNADDDGNLLDQSGQQTLIQQVKSLADAATNLVTRSKADTIDQTQAAVDAQKTAQAAAQARLEGLAQQKQDAIAQAQATAAQAKLDRAKQGLSALAEQGDIHGLQQGAADVAGGDRTAYESLVNDAITTADQQAKQAAKQAAKDAQAKTDPMLEAATKAITDSNGDLMQAVRALRSGNKKLTPVQATEAVTRAHAEMQRPTLEKAAIDEASQQATPVSDVQQSDVVPGTLALPAPAKQARLPAPEPIPGLPSPDTASTPDLGYGSVVQVAPTGKSNITTARTIQEQAKQQRIERGDVIVPSGTKAKVETNTKPQPAAPTKKATPALPAPDMITAVDGQGNARQTTSATIQQEAAKARSGRQDTSIPTGLERRVETPARKEQSARLPASTESAPAKPMPATIQEAAKQVAPIDSGLYVKHPVTGKDVPVDSVEDAANKFKSLMERTNSDRSGMDVFDAKTGQPVANVKPDGTATKVETRDEARARSEKAVADLQKTAPTIQEQSKAASPTSQEAKPTYHTTSSGLTIEAPGKPFANKADATIAKNELGLTNHEVIPHSIKGREGYALKEGGKDETPKGDTVTGKGDTVTKSGPKKPPKANTKAIVDPEKDNILVAIAKLGGIDRSQAKSQGGFDPAELNRRAGGLLPIFRKNGGKPLDRMAEALHEMGYPVSDNGDYTVNALLDAVDHAMRGGDVGTPMYHERKAQLDYEARAKEEDIPFDEPGSDWLDATSDSWLDEVVHNEIKPDAIAASELRSIEDEQRKQGASGAHGQAPDAGTKAAGSPARAGEVVGSGEGRQPEGKSGTGQDTGGEAGFSLTTHSDADLAARAAAVKAAQEAEKAKADAERLKAQADRELADFRLAGSTAPADVAMAGGQKDLFGPKTQGEKASIENQKTSIEKPAEVTRLRTKNAVTFDKPYIGKDGSKLTGYDWKSREEHYIDARGEDRTRLVSDWDQASASNETGRDIVHHFIIEDKNGNERIVSAETAAEILGVSPGDVRHKARALMDEQARSDERKKEDEEYTRTLEKETFHDSPADAINAKINNLSPVWGKRIKAMRDGVIAGDRYIGREQLAFTVKNGKYLFELTGKPILPDAATAKGFKAVEIPAFEVFGKDRAEPEAKPEEPATKPTTISDFGEKIGGAKKDLWQSYEKSLTDELPEDGKDITLSKHFPEPDYEAAIDAGIPEESLAAVKAMRDEIPTKPQKSWKVKSWAEKVKGLRQFAADIMSGKMTVARVQEEMKKAGGVLDTFSKRIDLYKEVGYPRFTKMQGKGIEHAVFNMFKGESHPGGVHKYILSDAGKHDRYFDTRQEAVDALKATLDAELAAGPTAKTTKLDIYRMTSTGDIIIGKKVAAGRYIDLKTGFKSSRDAREYLAAHQDELIAELERKKETKPERKSVNDPRQGEDYRKGEDVSPEKFGNTFGFRGVEFGNYVEGPRRQQDLNNTYDSLLDLATILNVPPKALSLNGSLGLAFGARGSGGKGAAGAHFEPNKVVINLTKTNGAGSLAHEWFHALDNYFSRARGEDTGHISDAPRPKMVAGADRKLVEDTRVRKEVLDAWKGIMDAIRKSGMVDRSKQLDARKSKDYWSTPHELTARAFEKYIIDRAAEKQASNDYLVNVMPEEFFDKEDPTPYPTNDEAATTNPAYQKLFDAMKHEVTDKGVKLYSESGKKTAPGLSVSDARQLIDSDPILSKASKHIEIKNSTDEIPPGAETIGEGSSPEGYYHNGKVTLFADNISAFHNQTAEERLKWVAFHELTHRGVGNLSESREYLSALDRAGENPFVRNLAAKIAEGRKGTPFEVSKGIATEEALAEISAALQTGDVSHLKDRYGLNFPESIRKAAQTAMQRFFEVVKRIFNRVFGRGLTDQQVGELLKRTMDAGMDQESGPKVMTNGLDHSSDIRYSARDKESIADRARREMTARMSSNSILSLWDRTVGTKLNIALKVPAYKVVHDRVRGFLNHTSVEAYEAVQMAPELLARNDNTEDYKRELTKLNPRVLKQERADILAASKVIYANTLGADPSAKKVFTDAELRAKGLTPAQVKVYRTFMSAVNVSLGNFAKSSMTRMLMQSGILTGKEAIAIHDRELPVDRHIAELTAITDKHIADIESQMQGASKKELKMLEAKKAVAQEAVNAIGNISAKLDKLKAEGYAPAMRFGNNVLTVYDESGKVIHFEGFDSARESKLAEMKFNAEHPKWRTERGTMSQERFKQFQGLSPETVALFAKEAGYDKDPAYQEYLKLAIGNSSPLKRMIHRKGIAGYSEDLPRILSSFVMSNARASSKSLYAGQMQDALSALHKAHPHDGKLFDDASKLVDYVQNPREEAQFLRNMMFHWYLAGSVGFGLVNLLQPLHMTAPWIAKYNGGKAGDAYSIVGKAYGRAFESLKTGKPPAEYRTDFSKAQREGHLDPANVYALQGIERGKSGLTNSYLSVASHALSTVARYTEQLNRKATFIAALDQAKKMGTPALKKAGFDSAYDFAVQAIQETQGIYDKSNRQNWSRGAVGALLMTYKMFPTNFVELGMRMAKQNNKEGYVGTAMLLGVLAVFSGMTGLPFAQDLIDALEAMFAASGHPFNTQRFMREHMAPEAADVLMNGVGAIPGNPVDLESRMSMGHIVPGVPLLNPTIAASDVSREANDVGGAAGNLLTTFYDSYRMAAGQGQYGEAVINAAPKWARSAAKAAEMATKGVYTDSKGRKVRDVTAVDALTKLLDIQPAEISRQQRLRGIEMKDVKIQKAKESYFVNKLTDAAMDGDSEKTADIQQEIADWNENNPMYQVEINYKTQIMRRVLDARKSPAERTKTPKQMRWLQGEMQDAQTQ